ncbi:hypothetical protein Ancab_036780 [Ancistrocladus abbreviatus]
MYPQPYFRRSTHSKLSSCILATFFLILLLIAVLLFFILFKPQDPKIAVNSLKFPAFSLSNGTVNFTFFQYVAVRNPNRYSFSHYDSSLQLYYSGSQVGFIFIPAGQIAPGRTQFMSATFDVRSFPVGVVQPTAGAVTTTATGLSGGGSGSGIGIGPTFELESRMKLVGSVRVLMVFAHHVESRATCMVTIEYTIIETRRTLIFIKSNIIECRRTMGDLVKNQ